MNRGGDSLERRVLGILINCKLYEGSDLSVSFCFSRAYKVIGAQEMSVEGMKKGRKGRKEGGKRGRRGRK